MRGLNSSRILSLDGSVAATALACVADMRAARTNAGAIARRAMLARRVTLESVNRADKGRCNEALLHNRAIGDGIPQSFIFGEGAETPFARQRECVPQLEKRVQSRSRLIDACGSIIIVDDRRAFPSDAEVGGERSLRLHQGYPQSRAYFGAVVLICDVMQRVELARNAGQFECPFGARQIGKVPCARRELDGILRAAGCGQDDEGRRSGVSGEAANEDILQIAAIEEHAVVAWTADETEGVRCIFGERKSQVQIIDEEPIPVVAELGNH